jgi:fibronectin-binding autotransporter adhesin
VYGGTLGGGGIIAGPVTVQPGGTLSPGTTLGTLTVRNTLNLAGTALMEIDRSSPPRSDFVTSTSTLTYGGTLIVTNLGPPLQLGDTFTLFTAATISGAFAATDLPALNPDLEWNTSNLSLNGTISVARMPPVIQVTNGSLGFDAGQFGFDVTGWAGQVVVIEVSANLLNWLPVLTNTLDTGLLHFSDPEPATPRGRFYRARGVP